MSAPERKGRGNLPGDGVCAGHGDVTVSGYAPCKTGRKESLDPMTPWQRTFAQFAGPGIAHPSSSLRVDDDEAAAVVDRLATGRWGLPLWEGAGRRAGYRVLPAEESGTVGLFQGTAMVGFYAGGYLWIAPSHRRRGLSTPLILGAAQQRGGGILPPGVVLVGYTPASLAAHRAAHVEAVLTALASGLPVPVAVRAELGYASAGVVAPVQPVAEQDG